MPGSGTDHTRPQPDVAGPVIVLVEPQMGENIGMVARAMGNFALKELRLVSPRDGWPNVNARRTAAGADAILDNARVFATLREALADCELVFATTARAHDQAKPVVSPQSAAEEMQREIGAGGRVAVLFGRERWGLTNEEVGLSHRIVTFPVNPAFASLNLAQSVLLMGYEWFKHASANALPFAMRERSPRAGHQQLQAFFDRLERELDKVEFFRPAERRETMIVNLRNIFLRMELTQQDLRTLNGIIGALAEGRKGPASGGVLDGEEAGRLRALLAEHGLGKVPEARGPVRGLARMLRRNPTDAERALWHLLTTDRAFAGQFKRQTPVGPHIADFVSFAHRLVIELVSADEDGAQSAARHERAGWYAARSYRVVTVLAADVTTIPAKVAGQLQAAMRAPGAAVEPEA